MSGMQLRGVGERLPAMSGGHSPVAKLKAHGLARASRRRVLATGPARVRRGSLVSLVAITLGVVPLLVAQPSASASSPRTNPPPASSRALGSTAASAASTTAGHVTAAARVVRPDKAAHPIDPVTSLKVTKTTVSTVVLTWVRPNEKAYGGVMIRRTLGATATTSPWDGELVARLGAGATTFTDADLSPSTTFSYSVFSFGAGPYSAAVRVKAATKAGHVTTTNACASSTTITKSATWSPAKFTTYDVACQLSVASGATLTIEPGTVVKLDGNAMLVADSGSRIVAGGAGAPVTFTSYRDPEVGGTVTEQPAPAPGDYTAAIELETSSSASITNAVIRFGNASVADNFYDAGCGTAGNQAVGLTDSIVTAAVNLGNCTARGHATFQVSANDFETPITQSAAIQLQRESTDAVSIAGNWIDFEGTTGLARAIWTQSPVGIQLAGPSTNAFAPGSGLEVVGISGSLVAGVDVTVSMPAGTALVLSSGGQFVVDGSLTLDAGTTVGAALNPAQLDVEQHGSLRILGTAASPVHMTEDSTAAIFGSGNLTISQATFTGPMSTSPSGWDVAETSCVSGTEHVTVENSRLDAGIQLGQCATAGSETLTLLDNVIGRPSGSQYLRLTSNVADPGRLEVEGNRFVPTTTKVPAASQSPAVWVDSWPLEGLSLSGSTENHFSAVGMNRVVEVADATIPAAQTWTIAPASGALLGLWSGAGYGPALLVSGTLDLAPGAVAKVVAGVGIYLEPSGTLRAIGTAAQRVTFTSIEDSSIDGDSNATGASVGTPSQKGGNYGVAVQADEDTTVDVAYATFRDGLWAFNPAYNVAPISRGAATITHCVFQEEVQLGDFGGQQVGYVPQLSDDTWAFNGAPSGNFASGGGYDPAALQPAVYLANVDPAGFSLSGSTANRFTGQGAGRVVDLIGTTVPSGTSWTVSPATGAVLSPTVDYDYLTSPGVTVAGKFTIGPSTVVKANGGTGIDVMKAGVLDATEAIFTAIADDSVAGDSNGDGKLSTPKPGAYGVAIEFDNASGVSTVVSDHFSYASDAINVPNGGNADVSKGTFAKNETAVNAVAALGSKISFTGNAFSGNTTSINGVSTWSTITATPFHCTFVPLITATDNSYAGGFKPLVTPAAYASIEAAIKGKAVEDSPSGWTDKIAPGTTDDLTGFAVLPCVDVAVPKDSYTAVAIPLDLG